MTTNGYKVADLERPAARSRPGFFADLIAVPGNPLDDIDALRKCSS